MIATSIEPLEARIAPALIYAVQNDGLHLISFDSAAPGTILADVTINGPLHTNETISGIDFRPSNGLLYALGRTTDGAGYIYTLNTTTGALTEIGSNPFTTGFTTTSVTDGFAFDPVADDLRVSDFQGHNFRVNADTGALIAQDTTFHNAGGTLPEVFALAYGRNLSDSSATTLYGLYYPGDQLVKIGDLNGSPASPNDGLVTPISGISNGSPTNGFAGFDIAAATGVAFATLTDSSGTGLYTFDLAIGQATVVGMIGDGTHPIAGLSVALGDLKIVNDQLATYTDIDGDLVTVKTSGHGLTAADFHFATGAIGSQLIDLDLNGSAMKGSSLTITATPGPHGGDGFVNVGAIRSDQALGKVTVGGDLAEIFAGDGTNSLAALTVHSFGKLGLSTVPGATGLQSMLSGTLGALTVKTDLAGDLEVNGGSIGNVFIGGDLLGANDGHTFAGLHPDGSIGNVHIGGSIVGGNAIRDGSILSAGTLGTVTIGGSIIGGTTGRTGYVQSGGDMGAVTIGGDIVGHGFMSGGVDSRGNLASVTIAGSVIGGSDTSSGIIEATGKLGRVKIGGSLLGGGGDPSLGDGDLSGAVSAGSLSSVTIGGSVHGGPGPESGAISAVSGMGQITVGGDVTAGSGNFSGSIDLSGAGHIAGVHIGGSLVGGSGVSVGITALGAGGTIGPVFIGGEIRADLPGEVSILAEGTPGSITLAIASLTVKGSVRNALITGGLETANPDAAIGAVTIGGNWIASSLAAGVTTIGHDTDVKASEATPNAILSTIGSVTIHGYVAGQLGGHQGFGIEAEQIGKVKVGTRTYTLLPGTDKVGFALGTTGDVRLREVDTTAASIPAPPASTPDQLAFTNTASIHTATFLDEDGDLVTIKITGATAGATLGAGNLSLLAGPYGSHLATLDLSDATAGQVWKDASVSITAKPKSGLGDSFVNVGYLNATGVDLGNVTIQGDLGQIDSGDSSIGPRSLGLKSLTVQSLGFFGVGGQQGTSASTESDIKGSMSTLTIKTDLARATVNFFGDSEVGAVRIGGDIIGDAANPEALTVAGGIMIDNDIGSLAVSGSLLGGAADNSGMIATKFGHIDKLTVNGSIFGGAGEVSGYVKTFGLGPVTIKGDLVGGSADETGVILAQGNITSLRLGGSIIGQNSPVEDSGLIFTTGGATNNIGPVKIGGGLFGASGYSSGSIVSGGAITSVTIARSLIGAGGGDSGAIISADGLGHTTIGGDLRGGAGDESGSIVNYNTGAIGNVAITGSLTGSAGHVTGIISNGHLGAVTIGGGIRGADSALDLLIAAVGDTGMSSGIKSVTVKGSVSQAGILSGYSLPGTLSGFTATPTNPDAGIGAVSIGGDLLASSIVAGVQNSSGLTHFGDGTDMKIPEATPDAVSSRIASITIAGFAAGTPSLAGDHFGFVAELVGKVKVGTVTDLLIANDALAGLPIGPTGDLSVREV